ncbi:MAG: SDR family oxidoreductase, partial [Weeksellaceae bacterium]
DYNPNSIIIRTAWVYSPYGHNFLKTMLRLFKDRNEISVVNDQVGTPTNANDLAKAILHIIQSKDKPAGIYHYTNAGQTTWFDFAMKIKEVTHSAIKINPIPTSAYPTPAKRPKYSVLNTQKIQDTFGVDVPDWEDGVERVLNKLK